jgi:plasmid stabilization system protein ParE
MKAILHPDADAELDAAALWYENQSTGLGLQFVDEAYKTLSLIERQPRRFALLGRRQKREMRRAMLSRFPYAVIYHVRDADILIVAIAHGHRRPNYRRSRLE